MPFHVQNLNPYSHEFSGNSFTRKVNSRILIISYDDPSLGNKIVIFWTLPASLHFDKRQYWHLGLRGILLRYFHLFLNFLKGRLSSATYWPQVLTEKILLIKLHLDYNTILMKTKNSSKDIDILVNRRFLMTLPICHVICAHWLDGLYHMLHMKCRLHYAVVHHPNNKADEYLSYYIIVHFSSNLELQEYQRSPKYFR